MNQSSLRLIVKALNDTGVDYLVVGGLAMVAHGYLRSTSNLDVLPTFNEANLARMAAALRGLGFAGTSEVSLLELPQKATRDQLIRDGNHFLRFQSAIHSAIDIHILIQDQLDFDQAFSRRVLFQIDREVSLPVCAYDDLLSLKRLANRPIDALDLQQLEMARSVPSEAELHDPWFSGTFEGSELLNLHRSAAWSFADKIKRIEESQNLGRLFQNARQRTVLSGPFLSAE